MIVIMGATGQVGGAVLAELSKTRRDLRAISRQPRESRDGVEWVVADALDRDALAATFAGAEAVFVLNAAPPDASDVHAAAAALSDSIAGALATAAVPFGVALSSQGAHLAEGTGIVKTLHRFEQALRTARATQFTFLRPAYFMQSWVPLAQAALATGEMPAFLDPPSKAIDTVSAQDVGRLAAHALLAREPGILNVTGPDRCSDEDAARLLAELAGRPIAVASVPAAQVAAAHEAAGLGPSFAAGIAGLYEAINRDGLPFERDARTARGSSTLRDVFSPLVA
jgi:NAD(P)H dehydrogenase (quinone)